jgi:hypothetical protein
MTEERPVQEKLSLVRAFRRVAAKFRRGETSPDYQRWERAQDNSVAEVLREEGAAEALRDLGGGGLGGGMGNAF